MPLFFLTVLAQLMLCVNVFAQNKNTFYVSQKSGSEQGLGSLKSPFKTIQQCADIAQSGDICTILAGTYRETVVPANSGVTFKNYNADNVVISGTEVIANASFSKHAGNIYKSPLNWSLNVRVPYFQSTNNQVFVNEKMLVEARWSNIPIEDVTSITNISGKRQNNPRAESAMITNATTAQYNDKNLAKAGKFWGTSVNKGKISFAPGFGIMATTCDISTKTEESVAFQCKPDEGQGNASRNFDATEGAMLAPKGNNYYFLWGKLEALDSPGEFFIDPPDNSSEGVVNSQGNYWQNGGYMLYLQMPDNSNPITTSKIIEVRKRMYGFDLNGKSNITLDGIRFFAATIQTDGDSNNNTFQNLEMRYLWHTQELPPLFRESGTEGLVIRGSNNLLKDSYLAYTSGTMLSFASAYKQTNSGNQAINNVIHDVGYGGFGVGFYAGHSSNGRKHLFQQNTLFNGGRYLIAAGSAVDILNNDVYKSHLQITDLGAIYGWKTDGKGSNIAFNSVHDILAERVPNDDQFGGYGIYLDDESTDFNIYRNLIWNTTSAGLMFTSYNPAAQENGGKTSNNRVAYNNTLDGEIDVLNKYQDGQHGFQTGTQIKNNIITKLASPLEFEPRYGTIDWENNWFGGALFNNEAAADYSLQTNSPAINAGLNLPPYTNDAVDKPDIGALENGKSPFITGAVIGQNELKNLKIACEKQGSYGMCIVTRLPFGRKIPSSFKIKIGSNGSASGDCANQTNYETQFTTAICKNVDLGGSVSKQPVFVSIDKGVSVAKGSANFDGLKINQVTVTGTKLTVNGQQFATNSAMGFSREISLQNDSGQKLYNYQVPVVIDTKKLITEGKMRADCGDIRFNNEVKNLNYWLEEGCNTAKTRLWVKVDFISNDNEEKIYLSYGIPTLTSASNGRSVFIWFEDFEGKKLNSAINLWTAPQGFSVGMANGEMKISGTSNSFNRYDFAGFSLFKERIPFPNNFAIDSELQVIKGTHFLANLGGADATMTLRSGVSANKEIAYYDESNRWQTVGKSTVVDASSIPKIKFSFGQVGEKSDRTLQWRENGDTQTVLATRTNVNNPSYGFFTFRSNEIETFEARFDNLRVRNLIDVEPKVFVSAKEIKQPTLQVLVNGSICTNVQFINSRQLTCNVSKNLKLKSITVVNPNEEAVTTNY